MLLSLLISAYCSTAMNIIDCKCDVKQCIERVNHVKYVDSQWLDVPNEKMSIESFHECTQREQ